MTVIVSHGKSQIYLTINLKGEDSVFLLLALKRSMFHEEAIELDIDSVRSRVNLNVENNRR